MSRFSFDDYTEHTYGTKKPVTIDESKSLTSFHPFPSLPRELQLHIFSLACENHTLERFYFAHGLRDLDLDSLHQDFFNWTRVNIFWPMPRLTRDIGRMRNPKGFVYERRNRLMWTSKLGRQTALEAWVGDLKALDRKWVDAVLVGMGKVGDMWERIGKVIDMLEGLIEEIRKRRGEKCVLSDMDVKSWCH